jgi:tRNA(Ile)-lysidine synthase
MLDLFISFLQKEELCVPEERILVSVSGGPDSVLLAHLFRQAGYAIGLAHCNYQLRGADSEADEAFVSDLAAKWNCPFYLLPVPTRQLAEAQGRSIQEIARDTRYEWLEKLCTEAGYDRIATGHHLNDSIETLLLNLTRGCGIRGLHGILPRRGRLIRPLLFATKEQIIDSLVQAGLSWRDDRSNEELYYDRNKIRHQVVPVLKELNPNFEEGAGKTLQRIRESERFFEEAVRAWTERAVSRSGDGLQIAWDVLQNAPAPPTLLYEILAPYGFRSAQLRDLSGPLLPAPGKRWYSPTHRLLADRGSLLLEPLPEGEDKPIYFDDGLPAIVLSDGRLSVRKLDRPPAVLPASEWEAALDARAIQFPLCLRRWRPGDVFRPMGMGGRSKKLQDFFSDLKMTVFEKEKVWILESGGQIAWIIGLRIDEMCKLQPDSGECWHFRFEKE